MTLAQPPIDPSRRLGPPIRIHVGGAAPRGRLKTLQLRVSHVLVVLEGACPLCGNVLKPMSADDSKAGSGGGLCSRCDLYWTACSRSDERARDWSVAVTEASIEQSGE